MSASRYTLLQGRGILAVTGPDAADFLQGIVTTDVRAVSSTRAAYGAMLTPQGKFLFDFFILRYGEGYLLDCEADRAGELLRRLTLYRLRAKVALTDDSTRWTVAAVFGGTAAAAFGLADERGAATAFAGGAAFVDPRLSAAGARTVLADATALDAAGMVPAPFETYDVFRISLGLPDGARDIAVERNGVLEAGFDELAGVDWSKGCFLGQEVTARAKYRGLVKKRLIPVAIDGPSPAPGTPIQHDGRTVGEMRSNAAGMGLALLRLDALGGKGEYAAEQARLTPRPPDWMILG